MEFVRPVRKIVRAERGQSLTLPLLLALLTIVTGLVGWTAALFDGTLNSITRILIHVARSFALSADGLNGGNRLTDVATFLGVVTTLVGASLLSLALLGEAVAKLRARFLLKGHAIVIGDTVLARRAAEIFEYEGFTVIHAVPPGSARTLAEGPARLRFDCSPDLLAERLRAPFARHTLIDLGSDATTLKFGAAYFRYTEDLSSAAPRVGPRAKRTISLAICDETVGDQYAELLRLEPPHKASTTNIRSNELEILSKFIVPNRLVARTTLAENPLFEFANKAGQNHVHAIIFGFGDLGEKLFDQVLLTSLTSQHGAPRVTIVDRNSAAREANFRARRPNVLSQFSVEFINLNLGHAPLEEETADPAIRRLLQIDQEMPATAIFICLTSDEETVQAGLLLRRLANNASRMRCPIFYRWKNNVPGEVFPLSANDTQRHPFLRMDLTNETLTAALCEFGFQERLAENLHASYLRLTGSDPNASWTRISNSARQANIRAADHLPAKLWSVGIRADVWKLFASDASLRKMSEATAVGLRAIAEVMEHHQLPLARLEHERWCIERKLEGWVWGAERDDMKRAHPSLVTWEHLVESNAHLELQKVYEQIRAAICHLIAARE
jgi:hypothetical protein